MSRVLPILFNTDMVRATLDNHKTAARRIIKQDKIAEVLNSPVRKENPNIPDKNFIECLVNVPYEKGDILYVRETWAFIPCIECTGDGCGKIPDRYEDNGIIAEGCYIYRAGWPEYAQKERVTWRPSIHMPKQAARIWLKVTDVGAERLQDMILDDFLAEGVVLWPEAYNDPENAYGQARRSFVEIWNSTIKKSDLEIYGWNANPWVWDIEVERCEKPEDQENERYFIQRET